MADFTTDVRYIKGIGEARAKSLQKLGITDLRGLISYFPRAYEDRRAFRRIADLVPGENACVRAIVAGEPTLSHIRKGLDLVKLRVVDESAALDLTYFNQSYLKGSFRTGEEYVFYGRAEGDLLRRRMTNPLFEPVGEERITGRIMPIYPLTAGVSQTVLSKAIRQGLDACADDLSDFLPEEVRAEHRLCHVRYAYENIHFPADDEALAVARRRLVFEELYLLTLGLRLLRNRRDAVTGQVCRAVPLTPFYDALPFTLTGAQRRAIEDAARDMCSPRPMNRLVQGDVGSGKTMVAAAAVWFAAQSGLQSALMAPTEILAEQHYKTLAPLLESLGVRCALLTASTPAKTRRSMLAQLQDGEITLAIGTHALLSPDVQYQNLGLVVTDEQHRFGVGQRAALGAKGDDPHLLVMSATPIPRTLALMIYGDLDVSLIDELPPGRQHIDTFAVNTSYRKRIYDFVRKLVGEGRQAYIVCPMVAENDELPDERKAVTAYAEKLRREVFPDLSVAPIHGRMKAKEKEQTMRAFAAGEIDVLVSTTVVEVGVDVPNAAVMLIENAECFGLSQLHQLRGRVGRGQHKSYCILVSDNAGEDNRRRLAVMTKTNNGFEIAEEDLKLRGPGDFFGSRQHGLPSLRVADLTCDMELLHESRAAAERLLADDPELAAHPMLRRRIDELFELKSASMN
ncbi:MAG: ATP-dependent DNA helicase RecG [Ruminococcaceae bacterium]|nr:ATP-dependent DNA helicase RecG [Oscillospiraceae bacterium]